MPLHEKNSTVGKHPLQLYFISTSNVDKGNHILLEELVALGHEGAEHDAFLIHIGEQHEGWLVAINPKFKNTSKLLDSKLNPTLQHESLNSGAILVYLEGTSERVSSHWRPPLEQNATSGSLADGKCSLPREVDSVIFMHAP